VTGAAVLDALAVLIALIVLLHAARAVLDRVIWLACRDEDEER
jgi:hypothetical protein